MDNKEIKSRIIYEDNHLIAVNKKCGWLVQGDSTGDIPLSEGLKIYLKEKYDKPGNVFVGTIHRLDRPVSGLVIFAKTSKALSRMNELFKNNKVKKTYYALSDALPEKSSGRLDNYLLKSEMHNVTKVVKSAEVKDAKRAILDFKVVRKNAHFVLFRISPLTGRPHQIRVQLSNIGCPILADMKYGSKVLDDDTAIYLHSHTVEFLHPVTMTKMTLTAPLPETGYWNLFDYRAD
ncbi:MAG TPA: RluA family pseudouridine synthase [Saprospiraceae bacterium]|nr:RluA family pseudouridine synthase [Saprospiraceae bacterium]HQW55809.1 RluA family pseudouridine synthase [Saprospiraceae bacterium]